MLHCDHGLTKFALNLMKDFTAHDTLLIWFFTVRTSVHFADAFVISCLLQSDRLLRFIAQTASSPSG